MCRTCRGPAAAGAAHCFACRLVAHRLGLPLTPALPARLCPLPGPLYSVLLGYKESPVAEARVRFAAVVRALVRAFLPCRGEELAALAGGPIDTVCVVPSTRRPGGAPLGRLTGLPAEVRAALPRVEWVPGLLERRSPPGRSPRPVHMRPEAAAFIVAPPRLEAVRGAYVLLLDDTYVSGARAQSAAAALRLAGALPVIAPLGRVLRPDRVPRHADFLARHAAGR